MSAVEVVVHYDRFEAWSLGRTLGALNRLGVHSTRVVSRSTLPSAIASSDAVWLVEAGAVPHAKTLPPPSATGKPLVALGAARCFSGRLSPEWNEALAATGGLFERAPTATPHAPSIFLEHGKVLARALEGTADPSTAALSLATRARVVRVPTLDAALSPRMRVMLAITTLHRGGAERVVLDLAEALPTRDVEIVIAVLDASNRETYAAPPGTIFLHRPGRSRRDRIEALARAARAFGADLVHAHLLDGPELAYLRAQGLPVIVTAHNARAGWPSGYESLSQTHASLVLGCSLATTRELREAGCALPIRTAWNGITTRPPSPSRGSLRARVRSELHIADSATVLVTIANPRPQKRLERLVAIAEALRERGRDVHVIVVGGAASACATSVVPAAEGIHAVGSQADVSPYLAAADVFVSASAYEGLSLAHLEAIDAGLPLVVTRAGGTEELARAHPTCVRVDLEASARDFATAIEHVLAEPPDTTSKTLARPFTVPAMADRHAALYRGELGRIARTRSARGTDIVLVTNNFSTGGAQSSARRLLHALRGRGIAVRAAVLEEQQAYPTPGRSALQAAGIEVHVAPRAGANDPRITVDSVALLVEEAAPKAVVFWNAIPEHKVLLADALVGTPVFDVSPGEMYFRSLARYFARPCEAAPYLDPRDYGGVLSGVIVKYGAEAERARDVLGAPVVVIPNGVVVAGDPPTRERRGETLVFGTLARIGPDKKLEELLDAFARAAPRLPRCELRIAGSPETGCEDYASALRSRLVLDAPHARVQWVGEQDSATFLAELDVFALVAEPAGCPNASLEAMAAGLPIVATDVGGMSEQVVTGENGWLTPRGDVEAFAKALLTASTSREALARGGHASWIRARERFSIERMTEGYVAALGL